MEKTLLFQGVIWPEVALVPTGLE
ncbi:hypothetical protein RSK20926_19317 [Roseobacter sp. SK209-2-6]|nr:hypothetical protein RSK20926_19317 [Roseobacter sp. SK209-2-6]